MEVIKKNWGILLAVAFLALLVLLKLYRCPFEWIVGIPCPCCGMSRALKSALLLRFKDAFYYHPLWPFAVVAVLGLILIELNVLKLSKRQKDICIWFLVVAVIVCFVVRHIMGSPIVQIHFEKSLVYHIYSFFATHW